MPHRSVSFNRLAIKEFREAREWYANRSLNAAADFISAVNEAVARIVDEYEALPAISPKFRRVRVVKFPFILVFYSRSEHEARVVAVAHTSRRPSYWRRRE